MKILINNGFNKNFSKVILYKNSQEILLCPIKEGLYEIEAKKSDLIVVKLKSFGNISSKIADFVCDNENDTIYVNPTKRCKEWEFLNFKIFPYFSLLFLVLKPTVMSEVYEWFCTSIIVLTALSLICFQFYTLIPAMSVKLFKIDKL